MNRTWVSAFGFIVLMFTAVAWASPVPDTGQTKCYGVDGYVITCPSPGQPFYGQDANYTINPMSYTKLDGSGNELPDSATFWVTVRDNVTGLIWEMKTNKDGVKNYNDPHDADNDYTWYDSDPASNGGDPGTPVAGTDTEDFIKALNDTHYGGYSDWRMPTFKELDIIVNFNIPLPGPSINTNYFPNTQQNFYWSSTSDAYYTDSAWGVNFNYGGNEHYISKNSSYYVRAVRGGQSGSLGIYKDNSDGTVTDTSTGLTWQQAGSDNAITWEQALAYCEGLNLGGYTDWRMPTIKELRSIKDYSRDSPAINTNYFLNTQSFFYWSATTCVIYANFAWGVDFYHLPDEFIAKSYGYCVRAVRGGRCLPDIKANGMDGDITVTSGTAVSIAISLTSGDKNEKLADWWFAINSPWGWYFLTTSELTQIPMPLYQSTPLYDFSNQKMVEGPLPVGDYEFFFGVYLTPNDTTNSPLYMDSVKVYVK